MDIIYKTVSPIATVNTNELGVMLYSAGEFTIKPGESEEVNTGVILQLPESTSGMLVKSQMLDPFLILLNPLLIYNNGEEITLSFLNIGKTDIIISRDKLLANVVLIYKFATTLIKFVEEDTPEVIEE